MSFPFGQSSSSGSSSLFGTSNTNKDTNNNKASGLFGSSSTAQPSSSLFGARSGSSTGGLFGSTSGSSAPTSTVTSNVSAPSLFGATATTQTGPMGSGGIIGTPGGLFSTPSKTGDTSKPAANSTSLFGGNSTMKSTSSLFGSANTTAATSNSTTPAIPKSANIFDNTSMTPAGVPPTANAAPTLFGSGATSVGGSSTNTTAGTGPSAPPSLFTSTQQSSQGGVTSLFGAKTNAGQATPSLFGSTATNSSQGAAGNNNPAVNAGNVKIAAPSSLFGSAMGTANVSSSGQTAGGTSEGQRSNTTFDFASPQKSASQAETKPGPSQSISTTAAPSLPNVFGAKLSAPPAAQQATSSQPLFASTSASATQSATTQANSTSFTATTGAPGASTSAPSAGATTTASSATPANPPASLATGVGAGISGAAAGVNKTNSTLGTSTAGPKPTPQSRLKNKSMDEIITRWASDLQKYQKEFQNQANKVAAWDKVLVTSSDQIQKLYGNTLEAERATAEVERQLTVVENDQSEIEYWLEHYEKQVDDLLSSHGSGAVLGEGLQGPDAERERTFKLAERLSDRLTEMGKDLGSMVDEINEASKGLGKGAKENDPLSQIVRVLNGHLSQLQTIDQSSSALQNKITAAQAASRGVTSSNNLLDDHSADDFYRSFSGRR